MIDNINNLIAPVLRSITVMQITIIVFCLFGYVLHAPRTILNTVCNIAYYFSINTSVAIIVKLR